MNLANRKAAKTRLDLKEEIDRVFSSGRLGADGDMLSARAADDLAAAHEGASSNGGSTHRSTGEPTLELDLTPLENYVKEIVALSGAAAHPVSVGEDLREMIREIVREEISARLKPLLGG